MGVKELIKLKKAFKKIFVGAPVFLLTGSLAVSCSSNNSQFYLANFQSYMADNLLDILKQEHNNFNFRSFATNEDLERKFSTSYDVAIASTYLVAKLANSGELEPLDWSKFGLYQLDQNGNRTDKPITNAKEALTLFDSKTQNILTNIYYLKDFPNPEDGGLLNYCVPYFLQSFVFTYKSWNDYFPSNEMYRWDQVIDFASQRTGKNKEFNKIAMIDDYRSIYSIPRLIQTKDNPTVNPGNPVSTNPQKPIKPEQDATYSIDEFENTYSLLKSNFKPNSFLLNSDSNIILNDFTDDRGSDAGIMYNGDALYAYQGGDNFSTDEAFGTWIQNHFQEDNFRFKTVDLSETLIALDAAVINKNSRNIDEAYEVIKKIALEGADLSLYQETTANDETANINEDTATEDNTKEYADDTIFSVDENDNYIYGPMINFDYVQYTSPLRNLNTYVTNSLNMFDSIGGYFKDSYQYLVDDGILTTSQFKTYITALVEIFDIKRNGTSNNTLEQNLSDINKSNMYYAFQKIKPGI